MGVAFCSLTVQQPRPESWEREEGAARSQQPNPTALPHAVLQLSHKIHQTQHEFLHLNPLEGHPAGIWGHGYTSPLPANSNISQVFTAGKVQLQDLTGKKRHSQKKGIFIQNSTTIGCSHYPKDLLGGVPQDKTLDGRRAHETWLTLSDHLLQAGRQVRTPGNLCGSTRSSWKN